jgi:hypothetical protein
MLPTGNPYLRALGGLEFNDKLGIELGCLAEPSNLPALAVQRKLQRVPHFSPSYA